jgi:NTE family protein
MINRGLFPTLALSPNSALVQTALAMTTLGHREPFRNFRSLLESHVDFGEIASWGPRTQRPILMIGAANITTGKLTKFISLHQPIRVEHILASCAVPNIFPAVQIDGDAYWDGLFSDNPPVQELIRPASVGMENVPDEIWLIKINRTSSEKVPMLPDQIVDRRNQLEGNISLFQQLRQLELINDMILQNAFQADYLAQFAIKAPIRIPKSFPMDAPKPYHIPWIEMPAELQDTLDFETKLDRSGPHIDRLIAAGEHSAKVFLQQRMAMAGSPPPGLKTLGYLAARQPGKAAVAASPVKRISTDSALPLPQTIRSVCFARIPGKRPCREPISRTRLSSCHANRTVA